MKVKTFIVVALSLLIFAACGSSKSASKDAQPKLRKQEVREVDKLAAKETTSMRAVGIGNDYDEKSARHEAIRDAQATLAGYIETAVVALTQEYHKKTGMNVKKVSETQIEGLVETSVAQKVSTKMVGTPEIYDAADGSIQVYVCMELTKPTKDLLGDIHEDLTREEILAVDYDKQKFIKDNMERIKELRAKAK